MHGNNITDEIGFILRLLRLSGDYKPDEKEYSTNITIYGELTIYPTL